MTVVNLTAIRADRDRPAADFIRKDEYGRELYCFIGDYEVGRHSYSVDIWAPDWETAERHAAAMGNVTVAGQLYERGST